MRALQYPHVADPHQGLVSGKVDRDRLDLTILRLLCDAFYKKLINLLNNDFIITLVVADAISKEGKKMCEKFGMKKIIPETNHESSVYELKLFPPEFEPTSRILKELHLAFSNKYDEIKKS